MDFRQQISVWFANALAQPPFDLKKDAASIEDLVEVPKQRDHGDFAVPCFFLAKELRQAPPKIAGELAAMFEPTEAIAACTAIGPFLNFRVNQAALADQMLPAILDGSYFEPRPNRNEKIMVEYSQPNTHKAMHVGHARCAALGDALVRIFEWVGHEVVAANYIGDEGTHVARCLWYFKNEFKGEVPDENLGEFLGDLYVKATDKLDLGSLTNAPAPGVVAARVDSVKPHADEEKWSVVELETHVGARTVVCGGTGFAAGDLVGWAAPGLRVAGKEVEEKELKGVRSSGMICSESELGMPKGDTMQIATLPDSAALGDEVAEIFKTCDHPSALAEHARRTQEVGAILLQLEEQEPEMNKLWEKTKLWSMAEFHAIYDWLNCRFDTWFYESDFAESSKALVREWQAKGVFVESEGAVGADLTEFGLGFAILIKSNGTATYACRDLALASKKFEEYGVDRSVYVVDSSQSLHFQQVFKCLELMGYAQAPNCHHHGYAQVEIRDDDGNMEKMSSRKGNVVLFSQLQRELTAAINERFLDGQDFTPDEQTSIARAVSLAAIRYGMLKQDGDTKIGFNLKEWVDPKGNTGPYLLYPIARANSIQRKMGEPINPELVDFSLLSHQREQDVVLALEKYHEAIERTAARYSPHLLCTYLYELAKLSNSMYNTKELNVLKSEPEALKHTRASLYSAVAKVLAHGIGLLGMVSVGRM